MVFLRAPWSLAKATSPRADSALNHLIRCGRKIRISSLALDSQPPVPRRIRRLSAFSTTSYWLGPITEETDLIYFAPGAVPSESVVSTPTLHHARISQSRSSSPCNGLALAEESHREWCVAGRHPHSGLVTRAQHGNPLAYRGSGCLGFTPPSDLILA